MNPVQKLFEKDGFNLTLRTIYLREFSASIAEDFDPLIGGQTLAGQLRKFTAVSTPTTFADADGKSKPGLTFLTKFDFQYLAETDPQRVVSTVSATIACCYLVKDGAGLDKSAEFAWGESSALFHAWPYWREYAHAALARLNLPVTLMPMLDVQSAVANAEKAVAALAKNSPTKLAPKRARAKRSSRS